MHHEPGTGIRYQYMVQIKPRKHLCQEIMQIYTASAQQHEVGHTCYRYSSRSGIYLHL